MSDRDPKTLETEAWQIAEIEAGIAELAAGKGVSHDLVAKWLKSWGRPDETDPPVTKF